jgi:hypothetical protein
LNRFHIIFLTPLPKLSAKLVSGMVTGGGGADTMGGFISLNSGGNGGNGVLYSTSGTPTWYGGGGGGAGFCSTCTHGLGGLGGGGNASSVAGVAGTPNTGGGGGGGGGGASATTYPGMYSCSRFFACCIYITVNVYVYMQNVDLSICFASLKLFAYHIT